MSQYTMRQPSGVPVHLVPDFDTEQEAQDYANDHGISGVLLLTSVWNASPTQQGIFLEFSKFDKAFQLNQEGTRRVRLIAPALGILAADLLLVGVQDARLTPEGQQMAANAVAWELALADIYSLTDVNDVIAYDVVNDPAWP